MYGWLRSDTIIASDVYAKRLCGYRCESGGQRSQTQEMEMMRYDVCGKKKKKKNQVCVCVSNSIAG